MNHPVPGTNDALSTQIIIPQKQVGRKSGTLTWFTNNRALYGEIFADIYVSVVSYTHQVAAKGCFVAMISTTVETDTPENEIQHGLRLLGPIQQKWVDFFSICLVSLILSGRRFVWVQDYYEPIEDGVNSGIFISKSYDATTHFETTCLDVLDIFRRGTGEDFDFSKVKHDLGDEDQ